ncbi:ABC transporter ATP-binding protein [Lagierella massiliensis]|uniref:ABC transporter ATP-binding protein n=1 Tax=Lagierella massiliensis TaxID=1689303 RepID=UPI0006D8121A|nr:ABC transporter ATP-binding protein [Lagierella massiliensis]
MKINIDNISKSFDKGLVLNNINLYFESGKVYGLKGRNGSGKTMLLRAISGLILPDKGTIKIDDKILGDDLSFPPSVGVLIENPGYIPELSGKENLKNIADIKSVVSDKEINEIMKYFDLEPESKKPVKKYSLGMKQKLGLCMAFMEDPELILLDEPMNALDEKAVNDLKDLILKKEKEGKLIIIASHDLEDLEELTDEIIEMQNGEVVNKN